MMLHYMIPLCALDMSAEHSWGCRQSKGPSNHKNKSKTAHKRKAEKKARKIMRRGVK